MHDCEVSYLERHESDGMKGIMILLILLGHNIPLVMFTNGCMGMVWLYLFHIHAFFLLPFLYPQKRLTWGKMADYLMRFYTPFIVCFLALSIITLWKVEGGHSWWRSPLALVSGGTFFLREYTGVQFLWFLPAIFAATVIRCGYQALSTRSQWFLFVVSAFVALNDGLHIVSCELVEFYFHYWLLGLKYLFWGLLFRWTLPYLHCCKYVFLVGFCLGSVVFFVHYFYFIKPYLGGYLPSKIDFILTIILSFSYLGGLYFVRKKLWQCKLICYLGHNSLIVYLTHIYFGYITYWVLAKIHTPLFISAICCFVMMIGGVCLFIEILTRCSRLRSFFLPLGWKDFRSSWILGEKGSSSKT